MVNERGQLPIADSHDEILDAIQKNQVVLIRGETGSGKTTQVCTHHPMITSNNAVARLRCSCFNAVCLATVGHLHCKTSLQLSPSFFLGSWCNLE